VFILKEDKVVCFVSVLQVLILSNLLALICTKIVQNAGCFVSVANKKLKQIWAVERKNASKDAGATG
jgi:hypothetical protein